MTLSSMRDEVWTVIRALVENEGVTFNTCLYLRLQVLGLLPQISVKISFQAPVPLSLAYYPESMVYKKWHTEQGGISLLRKEIRVAHTLSKVLGGIARQLSKGERCSASPAGSDSSASSGGMWVSHHRSHSYSASVSSPPSH